MKKILDQITKLEEAGATNVNLIALVSDTSSEVQFYATVAGFRAQSNTLAEEGKIPISLVDQVYEDTTNIVRDDLDFRPDKMNVVKVHGGSLSVAYDEKNCRTYRIIKEWENSAK